MSGEVDVSGDELKMRMDERIDTTHNGRLTLLRCADLHQSTARCALLEGAASHSTLCIVHYGMVWQ